MLFPLLSLALDLEFLQFFLALILLLFVGFSLGKLRLQLTDFDVALFQPGGRFIDLLVDQFSCSLGILLCECDVQVNLVLKLSDSVELILLSLALQALRSELWDIEGILVLLLCLLSGKGTRLDCVNRNIVG